MDTTEELNGTYFYHGHENVSAQELFFLILIEEFSNQTGMETTATALMFSGAAIIPKSKVLGNSTKCTSIASKMCRRIFKNMRFKNGKRYMAPIGFGEIRRTPYVGAFIARWMAVSGYAQAYITMMIVAKKTRDKFDLIARPEDRITWPSF